MAFYQHDFIYAADKLQGAIGKAQGCIRPVQITVFGFQQVFSVGKLGNQVEIVVQCLMVIGEGNLFKIK